MLSYCPRVRAAALVTMIAALPPALAACRSDARESARGDAPPAKNVAPITTTHAAELPAPALTGAPDVPTIAARVDPAVVSITSVQEMRPSDFGRRREQAFPFFPFFGRGQDQVLRREGLGTGFVIDRAGHIATNAHVVQGATQVLVRLSDDRELDAKVIGRDPLLDVAVLSVPGARDIAPVPLGSSERLRTGEYVVAVGNPLGLGKTVTSGIVSAKGRALGLGPFDDFIQTDASINPGNSGGPLFNVRGEVVGINTAIAEGANGIGFAIPIDAFQHVLPQLIEKGHVDRARLGVAVQNLDRQLAEAYGLDRPRGALVADVELRGPAAKAGLRPGDLVLAVDGKPVEHSVDLPRMIAERAPGATVTLDVRRRGEREPHKTTVALGKLEVEAQRGAAEPPMTEEPPRGAPPSGLGITVGNARGEGAVVIRIEPGSEAGGMLRPGDVIVEADEVPIKNADDLAKHVKAGRRGVVLLRVRRGETTRYVAVPHP
ncbi:MAG: trypsin-like peptidase domain-containing protein [Labilithrix sp.]|nr:trypsin-like peptidase domain-containing protein [Labilithrix sp.]